MYVRLAFAVAAHLESEILLVDEVLAVGDAEFQQRCLGKLEQTATQGRTVLFISHSMPLVLRLCTRALLLDRGKVIADGSPQEVASIYLRPEYGRAAERLWPVREEAPGDAVARLHAVRLRDEHGEIAESIEIRTPFSVEIEYWNLQSALKPTAVLHFVNEHGTLLFATNDFNNLEWWSTPRQPGLVRSRCFIPGNFLAEGRIYVLAAVGTYNPDRVHACEPDAVSFQVIDRSEGDGVRGIYRRDWPGVMRPMLRWCMEVIEGGAGPEADR
jgi:lipopolysaccharide transport system ATP-binding protein